MGVTGTVSYWLSHRVALGVAVRPWSGTDYNPSCGVFEDTCLADEQTYAFPVFATLAAYPLKHRLLFLRVGAGLSYIREQELGELPQIPYALGILERRSYRPTLIVGTGADLRIASWVSISPILELIGTSVGPDALNTTRPWLWSLGVGLTVG